ncbi:MAG: hypothetical protein M3O22_00320 [Pseudomonadota bacterium]|nr:hypothetical protein [Pseudomonadota bacterium]
MTTSEAQLRLLEILPGVQPDTEKTKTSTAHWTAADKIRFVNGKPQKINGWQGVSFNDSNTITGKARSVYSAKFSNRVQTMVGTHTRLYSLFGTELVNVTPLETSTTAIADSLSTYYATLGNNPIATTNGSAFIVITDSTAGKFVAGDGYTLSGASTTNGIPNTQINATHIVRSVGSGTVTLMTSASATSTGSGGGASVVRSSGLLTVAAASHGMSNGDRAKLASAADTGGIVAAQINREHIIRNVAANTFDVFTSGTATSSVSGGGGASTTYQTQIDAGFEDDNTGRGYGMGLYGLGLYGVSKTSSSGSNLSRIWFFDRFGELVIATPGGQGGLYSWDGSTSVAPVLVTNAPAAINYAFVTDNICVTFGASNTPNKIKTSDQGALTTWSASSTNQVFEDDIEGVDRLISHAPYSGGNLIFSDSQTFTFRYIGLPNIFEIRLKDGNIGIIGPMARVTVAGIPYWMGRENLYMYRGGNIEVIPSATQKSSTLLNYIYDDINLAQTSKAFAWYNPKYGEIWWHYPSADSMNADRIARFNVHDLTWTPDTMDRIAAEYPNINSDKPYLINSNGTLYRHEVGHDDDGSAMTWSLTSPRRGVGRDNALLAGLIPDSLQNGNITATVESYRFPQSQTATFSQSYTIGSTTERVSTRVMGRFWDITLSGSSAEQEWSMGDWYEELQPGSRQ